MVKPQQRLLLLSLGCGALALATVLGLRAQRFPAEAAADPWGYFPPPPRDEAPAPPAGWGTTTPASPEGPIVALPSDPSLRRVGDGRHYPLVPSDPAELAASCWWRWSRRCGPPSPPRPTLPALGHQQQVIYRVLSHKTALAATGAALHSPALAQHLRPAPGGPQGVPGHAPGRQQTRHPARLAHRRRLSRRKI